MVISTFGTIGAAIRDYTGAHVIHLEVFPDPQEPAVYAARATVKVAGENPYDVFFLLKNIRLQKVQACDLEEVQFTTWPPEVRQ